jgi:magnesium transporter
VRPLRPGRRRELVERRAHRVGLPPGTILPSRQESAKPAELTLFRYGPDHAEEIAAASLAQCIDAAQAPTETTWIDVDGVHDVEALVGLGEPLGLHPLVLEDLAHTAQRPKLEEYDGHLFIVLRMLHSFEGEQVTEQVGLVLGKGFLISFQEDKPGDVFDAVRERILQGKGRIRSLGADYLAYALIDLIVDHYFVAVEQVGEQIERLEDSVLSNPKPAVQAEINALRREVIYLRKSIWPLREVVAAMLRDDSGLIEDRTKVYLRDVYDHTIQVVDLIETFRDVLSGLVDLYLSNLSHRLNEIMKLLTLVGAIFIPLTFIVGVYGMNFEYMPELEMRYGYFTVWAVMILLAGGALAVFRRKGWM